MFAGISANVIYAQGNECTDCNSKVFWCGEDLTSINHKSAKLANTHTHNGIGFCNEEVMMEFLYHLETSTQYIETRFITVHMISLLLKR